MWLEVCGVSWRLCGVAWRQSGVSGKLSGTWDGGELMPLVRLAWRLAGVAWKLYGVAWRVCGVAWRLVWPVWCGVKAIWCGVKGVVWRVWREGCLVWCEGWCGVKAVVWREGCGVAWRLVWCEGWCGVKVVVWREGCGVAWRLCGARDWWTAWSTRVPVQEQGWNSLKACDNLLCVWMHANDMQIYACLHFIGYRGLVSVSAITVSCFFVSFHCTCYGCSMPSKAMITQSTLNSAWKDHESRQ